jgi:TDG/mug DNA glycosylase family protein
LKPLNDLIKPDLNILFAGFNPSIYSAEIRHHFASPNNRFWTILYQAGITERKFHATEDEQLLDLGYGITSIVQRPTKAASEITKEEYVTGRENLIGKIRLYQPRIVCFVGKGVYLAFSGKKKSAWGVQTDQVVSGTIDFVAPSSSGLVRMRTADIVKIYSELPRL